MACTVSLASTAAALAGTFPNPTDIAVAYKANSNDTVTDDGAIMQRIPTKRASALSLKDNNVDPSSPHDLCNYGAGVNLYAYMSTHSTESLASFLRCPPSTPISNNGSVALSGSDAMPHGLSGHRGGLESSYPQALSAFTASEIISPSTNPLDRPISPSLSNTDSALKGRTLHPLEDTARARGITLEFLAREINNRVPAFLTREAEVVCGRLVYARCSNTDLDIRREIELRALDREVDRSAEEEKLCAQGYLHEVLGRVLTPLLFCYAANWSLDMLYAGLSEHIDSLEYGLAFQDNLEVLEVNGGDSLVFIYACALIGRLFHFVHADVELGWHLDSVDFGETFIDILVGAFRIAHGALHDKLDKERMRSWARFCDGNDGSVSNVEYLWLKALGFQMCITASEMYKTIDELKEFAEMVASSGALGPNAVSVLEDFWQNALEKLASAPREGKQTVLEVPKAGTPRMDALQCLLGGLTNGRPLLLRVEDVRVFSSTVGWPGSSKNATEGDEDGKAGKSRKMAMGRLQTKATMYLKKGARAVRRGLRAQG